MANSLEKSAWVGGLLSRIFGTGVRRAAAGTAARTGQNIARGAAGAAGIGGAGYLGYRWLSPGGNASQPNTIVIPDNMLGTAAPATGPAEYPPGFFTTQYNYGSPYKEDQTQFAQNTPRSQQLRRIATSPPNPRYQFGSASPAHVSRYVNTGSPMAAQRAQAGPIGPFYNAPGSPGGPPAFGKVVTSSAKDWTKLHHVVTDPPSMTDVLNGIRQALKHSLKRGSAMLERVGTVGAPLSLGALGAAGALKAFPRAGIAGGVAGGLLGGGLGYLGARSLFGKTSDYKIAPDARGPAVDLSDVHRSSGDSELKPKGDSRFMFEEKRADMQTSYTPGVPATKTKTTSTGNTRGWQVPANQRSGIAMPAQPAWRTTSTGNTRGWQLPKPTPNPATPAGQLPNSPALSQMAEKPYTSPLQRNAFAGTSLEMPGVTPQDLLKPLPAAPKPQVAKPYSPTRPQNAFAGMSLEMPGVTPQDLLKPLPTPKPTTAPSAASVASATPPSAPAKPAPPSASPAPSSPRPVGYGPAGYARQRDADFVAMAAPEPAAAASAAAKPGVSATPVSYKAPASPSAGTGGQAPTHYFPRSGDYPYRDMYPEAYPAARVNRFQPQIDQTQRAMEAYKARGPRNASAHAQQLYDRRLQEMAYRLDKYKREGLEAPNVEGVSPMAAEAGRQNAKYYQDRANMYAQGRPMTDSATPSAAQAGLTEPMLADARDAVTGPKWWQPGGSARPSVQQDRLAERLRGAKALANEAAPAMVGKSAEALSKIASAFARGFVQRCLEARMPHQQFLLCKSAACRIPEVAQELSCLSSCDLSTTFNNNSMTKMALSPLDLLKANKLVAPMLKRVKSWGPAAQNWWNGTAAAAPVANAAATAKGWWQPVGHGIKSVWNSGAMQPIRGAATGSLLGTGVDQVAGLAGYDTEGWGSTIGAGLGGLARLPGGSAIMRRGGQAFLPGMGPPATLAEKLISKIAPSKVHWAQNARDAFTAPPNLGLFSNPFNPANDWRTKLHSGVSWAGAGAGLVHNMADARGTEEASKVLDGTAQKFGYGSMNELLASPMGQFAQGWGQNGMMGGIGQWWSSLPPEAKWQLGLGAAGLLGGGAAAMSGHPYAGLGLGGLGALGVAGGLGAFGNVPGSAQALTQNLPPEAQSKLQEVLNHPEFQSMNMNEQSQLIRQLLESSMQNNELQRAAG